MHNINKLKAILGTVEMRLSKSWKPLLNTILAFRGSLKHLRAHEPEIHFIVHYDVEKVTY